MTATSTPSSGTTDTQPEPVPPTTAIPDQYVTRNLADLKPHPFNHEVYGEEAPEQAFVENVRANGITAPIIINDKNEIVSGNRRHAAGVALGLKTAPVIVRHYADALAEQQALIDANRQRTKTNVQEVREYMALIKIESERAKQRMATNSGGATGRKIFSEAEAGKAADKAAASLGLSGVTLAKGAKVLEAIDKLKGKKDQNLAAALKAALNKSYDGALKMAQEKELIKKPEPKAKPSAAGGTVKSTNSNSPTTPPSTPTDGGGEKAITSSAAISVTSKSGAAPKETQEYEAALASADKVATYTRNHEASKLAPDRALQWKQYLGPIVKWFNQLA